MSLSNLEHLLLRRMGQAIGDYNLVQPGDKILVAISGGRKSFTLMRLLDLHRRHFSFLFSLFPTFVDPGWDSYTAIQVRKRLSAAGFAVESVAGDVCKVLSCDALRAHPCSVCCRLKRQALQKAAWVKGCNKIALGDHLDDMIETLLMNIFFSGQIKALSVKSYCGAKNIEWIRPLIYVERVYFSEYVEEKGFKAVVENCPYKTIKLGPRRTMVQKWIDGFQRTYPRIRRSLLAAVKHVRASHLLDSKVAFGSFPECDRQKNERT